MIIVTWNGWHLLCDCLQSIERQTRLPNAVFVVDNGSHDQTIEMMRQLYPWVTLLCLPTNTGFSVANNRALRQVTSDYVALLNNDLILEPEWIANVVDVLDHNSSLGSCASKMLSYDRRTTIDAAGIMMLPNGVGVNRGSGEDDGPSFQHPTPVFGPCGGAAIYRYSMLREIGLFDEDFYLYYEDVDLAFRAQWAGYDCLYIPNAIAYHHHSASTKGQKQSRKDYWLARNSLLVLIKNMPAPFLHRSLRQIIIGQLPYAFYTSTRGQGLLYLRACLSIWWLLPRMLCKRRQIQQTARRTAHDVVARFTL